MDCDLVLRPYTMLTETTLRQIAETVEWQRRIDGNPIDDAWYYDYAQRIADTLAQLLIEQVVQCDGDVAGAFGIWKDRYTVWLSTDVTSYSNCHSMWIPGYGMLWVGYNGRCWVASSYASLAKIIAEENAK